MTANASPNRSANLALVRLLQLASPALPVGAYSYSQGLEAAIESGAVTDRASAERWIGDMLRHSVARLEAPVWMHLHAAWSDGDVEAARDWNDFFLATRESAELRAETVQMGYSLRRLLNDLDESFDAENLAALNQWEEVSFPAAFTFAAAHWAIPANDGLPAYLWSWLENQVMAAVKAVPLGQTDGQRMLARLGTDIVITIENCTLSGVAEMNNYCHGLAIASSVHETQYSRLFRS
jgi:urease accessory protein